MERKQLRSDKTSFNLNNKNRKTPLTVCFKNVRELSKREKSKANNKHHDR